MTLPKPLPRYEYLNKRFFYEAETGKLFWRNCINRNKSWNTQFAWTEVGFKHCKGYDGVNLDRKIYLLHRIIWKICCQKDPVTMIDHINGDKKDNRISNLRIATCSQNHFNRKKTSSNPHYKGVTEHKGKKINKFEASIRRNGKRVYLGYYSTPEEAHKKYCDFAKTEYGEFFNKG